MPRKLRSKKPKRPMIIVHMDGVKKLITDIKVPDNKLEADLLCEAAAGLLVKLSMQLPETGFGCHHGCVFAGIMEMAHAKMNAAYPAEYRRVVEGKLLTPSVVAGGGH